MNHLGVLIDFTALSDRCVDFAIHLGQKSGVKVSLVHAASKEDQEDHARIESRLYPYQRRLEEAGVAGETVLGFGHYEKVIPALLPADDIDLVVVGTHGIRGIKQSLFGSNILSLLQKLHVPALVVQADSSIPSSAETKILFPMAPHRNFELKVRETADMSKVFNSTVTIYTINKLDAGPGKEVEDNKALTIKLFNELGVKHEVVDEEATVYSFGYGKQIIKFAEANHYDFISIMSEVSSNQAIMGNADKEKIILNEHNIPVFSVNS